MAVCVQTHAVPWENRHEWSSLTSLIHIGSKRCHRGEPRGCWCERSDSVGEGGKHAKVACCHGAGSGKIVCHSGARIDLEIVLAAVHGNVVLSNKLFKSRDLTGGGGRASTLTWHTPEHNTIGTELH